jgi:membrane protein
MPTPNPIRTIGAVLRQTARDVWAGNVMEWAAALAFYGVLSLFPLLLAGAAAASLVVDPTVVTARLSVLAEGFLPPDVIDVDAIVRAAIAARREIGPVGVVLWLLAGRRILGALVTAMDRVSDVDERRERMQRRVLVELALLIGISGVLVLALAAHPLLGLGWQAFSGSRPHVPLAEMAGVVVQVLTLVAAFFVLYTIVPYGKRSRQAALIGAPSPACWSWSSGSSSGWCSIGSGPVLRSYTVRWL